VVVAEDSLMRVHYLVAWALANRLGWFELSTFEQWDIFLKILGLIGATALFIWTVRQWYVSKKMELEISVLENIASSFAHWRNVKSKATAKNMENVAKDADKQMEALAQKRDEVIFSELSLGDLRLLNKGQLVVTRYAERLNELMPISEPPVGYSGDKPT
jgi:hypothetical protein